MQLNSDAQHLLDPVKSQHLANVSMAASRDVARSIGEVLSILRRPGHDFGREFLLNTGADLVADVSLLASLDILRNANAVKTGFEFLLPSADDVTPPRSAGKMEVACVLVPLITGNLTCGLCLHMAETPSLAVGRTLYSAGRYVRCEATGELLSFLRPFGGVDDPNGTAAALLYSRPDSSSCRFQVLAVTRLGVTMRQVYNDYDRGEQGALCSNFTLVQEGVQTALSGCPQCGRAGRRGCNCDVVATLPKSSFDFRYAKVLLS